MRKVQLAWRPGALRGRLTRAYAFGLGLAVLVPAAVCAQEQVVDLELVLAVDASSSVSTEEFDLQMRGLAEAFRDPAVVQAIRASGDLGIAVSLIQWSDGRKQVTAVDWMTVRDGVAARALADAIEAAPRFLIGGGTAIGGALKFALRQFEDNGFQARRQVIDLSGDGRANQGSQPADMRDLAVELGVTINGLAILNEDPTIDSYYYANVIGGTGAFVMTANDYESYGLAILAKLIKEIAGVPVARAPGPITAPGPLHAELP
jgi:hypothetical protein